MLKKVSTAMEPTVTSVERAAAPTEKAVAGLSTLVTWLVILVDPSDRYFWRWSR